MALRGHSWCCWSPQGAGCSRPRTSCEFQSFSAPGGSAQPWWPLCVPVPTLPPPLCVPSPQEPKVLLVLQRLVCDLSPPPLFAAFSPQIWRFWGSKSSKILGVFLPCCVWDVLGSWCCFLEPQHFPLPCPPWKRDLGPISSVQNLLHTFKFLLLCSACFLLCSQHSGRLCPGVFWDLAFKPQI